MSVYWPAVITLLTILNLGCAEIQPPPGGEVDRTAPYLVESIPESGATGVVGDDEIVLVFSERVVEPTGGRAVFISPRPVTEPEIHFRGERIEISMAEQFQPEQTYIVSVSSEVADLRRNRLDSGTVIAFSTGDTIDTGSVSGEVLKDGKPAAGLVMALFEAGAFADSAIYDSLYPTYITISSKEGQFGFRYLPDGRYHLIGFEDRNRDEHFNPAREQFALPDRAVAVGEGLSLAALRMSVTRYDTLGSQIIAAAKTADNLVRLRLSKSTGLDLLRGSTANLRLRSTGDTSVVVTALGVLELDRDKTDVITGFFGELPTGDFQVELNYDSSQSPLLFESVALEAADDRKPPTIVSFKPGGEPQFVDQVQVRFEFSEPLDTSLVGPQTFALWRDENEPTAVALIWADPFHLRLRPHELSAGRQYRLDITEFELADLAGNLLGDSLTSYRFSTLNNDSLGSISGEVVVSLDDRADSPIVLTFRNINNGREFELAISDSATGAKPFLRELPPGEYLLSGFIDQDRDQKRYTGSIYPFRLAETWADHPDTVTVRARFETAGVRFEFK